MTRVCVLCEVEDMPVSGGPYLFAAFFCEKVLQEQDSVLSFIRAVDRWNIVGPTQTMNPTVIQATLVVLFRSGILRTSAQLAVTPVSPTAQRLESITLPILFEGDDERSTGIILPMGFPVQEPGLYWFEVALALPGAQPSVITQIPMRIVYLQTGSMMPPAMPTGGQQ
jgi:hypothetical protein